MKVAVVALIKNEEDIIESFIRHTHQWADYLVIEDNGSIDSTRTIVNSTLKELNWGVYTYSPRVFEQSEIITQLVNRAIELYNPDIVIPLDADELVIGDLSLLNMDVINQAKWKTYVPLMNDNQGEINPHKRITHTRDESWEKISKCIIPVNVLKTQDKFCIQAGNHAITGEEPYPHIENPDLHIAHFPIRSMKQVRDKIGLHFAAKAMAKERIVVPNMGWHIEALNLTTQTLDSMATNFAIKTALIAAPPLYEPLYIDYELKYTKKETR